MAVTTVVVTAVAVAAVAVASVLVLVKKNQKLLTTINAQSCQFHTFFDNVEEKYGIDVALELSSMEE